MMSVGALAEQMGAVATLGVSGGGGFYIAKYLLEKIFARWDKKEEMLDTATSVLVLQLKTQVEDLGKRLDNAYAQIGGLQEQLMDCRQHHSETSAELLKVRAMLDLKGQVDQRAAQVVAADRLGLTAKMQSREGAE